MKYIRTKDGRIIDCVKLMKEAKEHSLQNEDDYKLASVIASKKYNTDLGWQRRVIKQADTIEELCDEFVLVHTEYDNSIDIFKNREGRLFHRGDSYYNFSLRQVKNNDITIAGTLFGTIWTDKGLIYVAKMNEEGELELL